MLLGAVGRLAKGAQIRNVIAVDFDYVQMVVANAAADATENTHGTRWERGNWCEVLCEYALVVAYNILYFKTTKF